MAGRAFLGTGASHTLRILSFNVLADGLAQSGNFSFAEAAWLSWEHRFPLLLSEIKGADADVVCLAEANHVEDSWQPAMRELVRVGRMLLR
jgi:mRNA deadenylase 3'-5' endonuclease subunit Ccr4